MLGLVSAAGEHSWAAAGSLLQPAWQGLSGKAGFGFGPEFLPSVIWCGSIWALVHSSTGHSHLLFRLLFKSLCIKVQEGEA